MRLRRIRQGLAPLLAVSAMAALAPAASAASPGPGPGAPSPSSSASATSASAPASGPLARFTGQTVDWRACGEGFPASARCATLKAPLDYRSPGGRTIDVEISRSGATDPAKRRGVLFFNPGGPGGSGLGLPYEASLALPESVKERYDLIGFDPRGVGLSTPVACGLKPEQLVAQRPYKPSTFARDVAATRGVAETCRAKYGDRLSHFTTRNTARDMDVIRAALGERKLNYLGYSYGTYLGAVYTQMFPGRSDRIVLDSAIDPRLAWRGDGLLYGSEAEKAFARWTKWTAGRSEVYGLGDTPQAVADSFWRIVAQADRAPIVVGGEPLTGDQVRALMQPHFSFAERAARNVVVLKEAAAGRPTQKIPGSGAPSDDVASLFLSIQCGDAEWPRDPETYRKDAVRDQARYPLYGDHAANISPCAFWDRPVEMATRVKNGVRALILQNEWDPATPLIGARGLRKDMKNSRLVLVDEGEGHGIYAAGRNRCVDRITTAYLAEGHYPAADVTCDVSAARKQNTPAEGLFGPTRS